MSAEKFGRYEVRRPLGRGGMAVVYLAYDPAMQREVAVKVLPSHLTEDPRFRTRFEREVQMVAHLEHPGIVPVYDYGEEANQPYIVMRYMTGGSLLSRIRKNPLTPAELVQILGRVARALDQAHANNIIHRDLKPDNLLFDDQGQAYLSDFGIAKVVAETATRTGSAIMGTPAYMSPEQGSGVKDLDGRSDIYALGVIIFEALTGQLPYQADTPIALMMQHITKEIPTIHTYRPDLAPGYQIVIQQAMAKTPAERYASVIDLVDDLAALVRGESIQPRIELQGEATNPVLSTPKEGQVFSPSSPPPPAMASALPAEGGDKPRSRGGIIGLVALLSIGVLIICGVAAILLSGGIGPATPDTPTETAVVVGNSTATTTPVPTDTPTQLPPTPTSTLDESGLVEPTSTTTPTATFTPTPTFTVAPTPAPTTDFGLVVDNFEDYDSNTVLNEVYRVNAAWGANQGLIKLVGDSHANEGKQVMAFEFDILNPTPDDYSGFERDLFPQDWSKFSLFCFWIRSDGSGYDLSAQFSESSGEVWKHTIPLSRLGEEDVCLSLTTEDFAWADWSNQENNRIDLGSIKYYGFFVGGPQQGPGVIYIDDIRVTNSTPTPDTITTSTSIPTSPSIVVNCAPEPGGEFAGLWQRYKDRLGCPRQITPTGGVYVEQPFQNGHMYWSEDGAFYLVTIGDNAGAWQKVPEDGSIWVEGMPEKSCDIPTPEGFFHPIRGFGGLWCSQDVMREQIGWGLDIERGFGDGIDLFQEFERGTIFRDSDGMSHKLAYVMFGDDGTFIKTNY